MSKKKRSSRNLRITTRITITAILGVVIPVIIAVSFSYILLNSITSYFNVSAVNTKSYSMLNQIQWSQTMSSISNELASDGTNEEKLGKISGFVTPIEKIGVKFCIECNGEPFYSTGSPDTVLSEAGEIINIDARRNLNYFANDGMVIVNHVQSKNNKYLVVAESKDYSVTDISSRNASQSFSSFIFGKTGVLLLIIMAIFVVSAVALSLITSRTINKPIKKLAEGANEIAKGNLDFKIDYESTNEIGQTVKSFNDMTERLRESIEKQERVEQSRKEMLAGIAHDLRTPLTSAKGYVEGLRDGIANTPDKQERYLKTIYESTLSMEKMLDELLDISRLELGSIQLNPEPVVLNGFIGDCAEEISLILEKEGFDFEYRCHCADSSCVMLDAERFRRVIQNIVSNSVKYARKDVKSKVVLETQDYNKSVIISIADNGIGMDAQSLPRIFETFYRADKARTKVSKGSGIGLAVCKQIVELHGGHIWATSTEGEGLTILISLEKTDSREAETDE